MESGWITYYWSAPTEDALMMAIGMLPNLGVAQGGVQTAFDDNGVLTGPIYGVTGIFYTVLRSQENMRTPEGLTIADPFDCTGLLGIFE